MRKRSGLTLILVIFLLVVCSIVALGSSSLLSRGIVSSRNLFFSARAMGLAEAGKAWYLEKLENDNNWNDEKDILNYPFGGGYFDIEIKDKSSNSIRFTVKGKIYNDYGLLVRRSMSFVAYRLPKASLFALFWQKEGPTSRLVLSSTRIEGNVYSA